MMDRRWIAPVVALVLFAGGCKNEPFGTLDETLSAEIINADTTLFRGETAVFTGLAIYGVGPGAPQQVSWGVSDTSKMSIVVLQDLTASLFARETGSAFLIAVINQDFRDSVLVTIVNDGFLRWRIPFTGQTVAVHPAVGPDSNVVVTRGSSLASYTPLGDTVYVVAGCDGLLGPSVSPSGVYSTGDGCTDRHDAAGPLAWSLAVGDVDAGVAIAADGGLAVLHAVPDGQAPNAVVVSSISSTGAEAWRDTLSTTGLVQRSAPAIAPNGDIYVPWRAPVDSAWLSRIAADGTLRWTVPMAGWSRMSSPALGSNRIVLGHEGGITAFDTTGAVVWSRGFVGDGAPAGTHASSPVIDGAGLIYVQTENGLFSYGAAGQTIWFADSLGFGPGAGGIGAPSLRVDATLVVPCLGEVCAVRMANGSLVWRSAVGGGTAAGVAVGTEGTVFVTRTVSGGSSELVGLWSRPRPDPVGWPTEGGNMARTRRN